MTFAQEREWVRRAKGGDQAAFGEIVHCHQQAVFNVAYRLLNDVHDAEDATQEAFLRAYQFLGKFDWDRPLSPWLKQIAVNVCLNRLAGQRSASPLDDESASSSDPDPGPEALTILRDRDERIRLELQRLPPRYRLVVELRHFEDLSYEEIAGTLKRPVSDVKSDLFRARRLLAERLKDIL
ncbi:MAG TPA: sigma-70 family RNA polymerase sigma factor [Anaerolineales bacterium]|nr:sigma-70 family RNA polymerase sigma factor [Anaerolineales bacterium]